MNGIEKKFMEAVSEAIGLAFDEESTTISPALTRTKNGYIIPDDPLTFRLIVALSNQEYEDEPEYEFTLRDALSIWMMSCADGGSHEHELGIIANELRKLADEIDAVRAPYLQ